MPNDEYESPQSEEYVDNYPTPINDPECKHEYELSFEDAEGFFNYTCTKCPMGFRSKEVIDG